MNTEALRKEFQSILNLEERAKYFYDHYIDQLENEKIKNQLVAIRNDEISHIAIAKKLIEYVS
ncbi:MAG: hypothetical protein A2Z72_07865 [Omnitrophica bacterium RBG_13_46_9]|nr:MAG: hypothetical protein A2Z72_07865 [Omnitrophica bacterium RBG_13_46_9]